MVAPWIVAILGGIAVHFFNASYRSLRMDLKERAELYQNIFHIFYICALGYGAILIVALLILGTVFFLIMLRNAFSKDFEKKRNVEGSIVIWICSGICLIGTAILMFLVPGLTYGQSV